MKELIEQENEKTTVKHVKNLMETTNWTFEQAMDALMIPAENREEIKKRLEEDR